MAERPTLAHRAEYGALRALIAASGRLGDQGAERLGERLGVTVYALGIRRNITLDNLRHAFPEQADDRIARLARASYAHLGRELIVTLRLRATSPGALVERSTMHGLDAVLAAREEGRGVVLVTGHLGNWEVGAACLAARGIPLDVVMQRQSNPLSDRAIDANRRRLGLNPIDRRYAAKEGLRTLRDGRILGFVSDQDARSGGVFVPFFGRPASTHRGPALLALRTGAPLFASTAIRQADGTYDCRLHLVEESRDGEPEDAVERLTAAYTAVLEAAVRRAPEQYLWQHRRWKSQPRN